jgi:hypothetical protein
MAPSITSDAPGSFIGYMSASIDSSSSLGASGNAPSRAWLPMITTSSPAISPAIDPAARKFIQHGFVS